MFTNIRDLFNDDDNNDLYHLTMKEDFHEKNVIDVN